VVTAAISPNHPSSAVDSFLMLLHPKDGVVDEEEAVDVPDHPMI
jgi:hypothetical protein